MSNGTSSALNSEQDLDSIPTAQGGLSRLAIACLKRAGVPVGPLLRRTGHTPEVIAKPEERLSVRSQITLLDEAAIALKDHSIGFTLARDFDPRELGLHALKRVAQQDYQRALVSPPERQAPRRRVRLDLVRIHILLLAISMIGGACPDVQSAEFFSPF